MRDSSEERNLKKLKKELTISSNIKCIVSKKDWDKFQKLVDPGDNHMVAAVFRNEALTTESRRSRTSCPDRNKFNVHFLLKKLGANKRKGCSLFGSLCQFNGLTSFCDKLRFKSGVLRRAGRTKITIRRKRQPDQDCASRFYGQNQSTKIDGNDNSQSFCSCKYSEFEDIRRQKRKGPRRSKHESDNQELTEQEEPRRSRHDSDIRILGEQEGVTPFTSDSVGQSREKSSFTTTTNVAEHPCHKKSSVTTTTSVTEHPCHKKSDAILSSYT
ncbi:uncharacterized protein isoform X2 [Rhodnius prolixus]|uniref:uncharacterized protein isoform X2 n=1 Tax=Rhodnius prolixus TaxID=13249 RepID=UPI003D18AEE8